tara:strand:- start:10 stop:1395 length:1386 start_codon:yes stop_codon:yes gene_type:complete
MLIPLLVNLTNSNIFWDNFLNSSLISIFLGTCLIIVTRGTKKNLNVKQIFVLTSASWLTTAIIAALPFYLGELDISYTDAFFESMSGITTTGSTIISGLDECSPGILIWRAMLQWFGGIGFVVLAIAVLPGLRVSGNQLFQTEFSDSSSRARLRLTSLATWIGTIYILFTVICAGCYWLAGMKGFDAIVHSMTTIATGGFSTSDSSVGIFANPYIEIIAIIFMVIGSLPFFIYVMAARGQVIRLFSDTQVHWFFYVLISAIAAITFWQVKYNNINFLTALREAAFNVTSIITGTGFSTVDYWQWGGFPGILFLFLMFIGGCAGSTSCSIKLFRYQILYATLRAQLANLIRPHHVYIPKYNGEPISNNISDTVFAFFFIFLLTYALLAFLLSLLGVDFITSISSAATAITNVGPGLGNIVGPAGNFSSLPDLAKWLLSLGMLFGRLEIFVILVLFTRSFWKN